MTLMTQKIMLFVVINCLVINLCHFNFAYRFLSYDPRFTRVNIPK